VGSLGWLSRVPLTLKAAQELVHRDVTTLVEVPCDLKDYRMWEVEQTYGGVPQRWVLVESQTRKADASLWQPELEKLERRLNRQLKQLNQKVFACKPDALEALMQFQERLEVHHLTQVSVQSVRPSGPPVVQPNLPNPPRFRAIDSRPPWPEPRPQKRPLAVGAVASF
jgi:transposase